MSRLRRACARLLAAIAAGLLWLSKKILKS
jgi:hypothetical protein